MGQFRNDLIINGSVIDAFDNRKSNRIELIDLDKIKDNSDNLYLVNNIDELAENIKVSGIISIITVSNNGDGTYTVEDGSRRFNAINLLHHYGYHYKFRDVDIYGKIPAIIIDKFNDDDKKYLFQFSSNTYRDMSKEEKKNIILRCHETLTRLENKGEFVFKGRTSHVISEHTGISEHFVKDFLADLNKANKEESSNCGETPQKTEESEMADLIKQKRANIKKLEKSMAKTAQLIEDNINLFENLEEEFKEEYDDLFSEMDRLIWCNVDLYNEFKDKLNNLHGIK